MPDLHDLKPFAFGGVAACVAEASTFPIDTAKTRLQLQGQKTDRVLYRPYSGVLDVWRRIAAEEGPAVLYRGLGPALLRQASYGTIKFGLYYSLKEAMPGPETPSKNVMCAVLAGSISSAVANPTDVLKVRLQARTADGRPTPGPTSLLGRFMDISQKEGVRGLWRGVIPTAQRAAVVAGVQLPVYDACKAFVLGHDMLNDGAATHLISSFCAGLCACLASCPIDVIRTRMMGQRKLKAAAAAAAAAADHHHHPRRRRGRAAAAEPQIYRNSLTCAYTTVRNEGFLALYKGFVPSFMRMGPWNIIFFLVYEQLKKQFPPAGKSSSS